MLVVPTGPHRVKAVAEPKLIVRQNRDSGKDEQCFKFLLEEEDGRRVVWITPIYNKDGSEAHYLLVKLQEIPVGEWFTLEMKKAGPRSFISVLRDGDDSEEIPQDEEDLEKSMDEIAGTIEEDLKKERGGF